MSKALEFIRAICKNNLREIKRLISEGVSVDTRDDFDDRKTALSWAAMVSIEATKLLIENGADIHAQDAYGNTALSSAASAMKADTAQILIENGAEFKNIISHGSPIIVWAARDGHTELVIALIKRGADLNVTGFNTNTLYNKGKIALRSAAEGEHIEIVRILLNNGVQAEDVLVNFEPILIWASKNGYTRLVHDLLAQKINPNMQNHQKLTALILASAMGYIKMAKLLVQYGANVELTCQHGYTPLMNAAFNNHPAIIEFLVTECNAKLNAQSSKGETALTLALARKYPNAAAMILKYSDEDIKENFKQHCLANLENNIVQECIKEHDYVGAYNLLNALFSKFQDKFDFLEQMGITDQYFVSLLQMNDNYQVSFSTIFNVFKKLVIKNINHNEYPSIEEAAPVLKILLKDLEQIIFTHKENIRLLGESASFEEVASLGKILLVDKSLHTDIKVAIASHDITYDHSFAEFVKYVEKCKEAQEIGQ